MSDFENSRVQDSFADHLDQSRELGRKTTLDNAEQQRGSPGSLGGTIHHESAHQSINSAGMYLYSQKSFQKSQQDDRQIEMRQKMGAEESMQSGVPEAVSPIAMATANGTTQPSLAGTQRLPGAMKQSQTQEPMMLHIQLDNVGQEQKLFQHQHNLSLKLGAADGQDAKSEQSTESDGTQRPSQAQPAAEYGQEVKAQGLRHSGANKGSRNNNMNSKNALQLINEPQLVTHPTSGKSSKADISEKNRISDILITTQHRIKEIKESEKSRNADAHQQALNIQQPALGKNLELFVWGLNDNHQLGQAGQLESARGRSRSLSPMSASYKNVLIPRQVRDVDFDVQQIVCGSCHTLILSGEGAVYGLGNNSHGQLGQPVRQQPVVSRPTKIAFASKVAQLACSSTHSVIQTATGELYSCGLNSCGQLGLNPDTTNGQVVFDQFTQMAVPAQIDRFSCSDSATALLDTANQRIFVCGTFQVQEQARSSPMCELTLTPELENETVIDIKCGNQQMLMMTKSGKVFQVDESQNIVQLNSLTHVSEIQAHGEYFAALTSLNRIHHWKYGHAEPFRMLELSQPSSSASQFHALSIGDDYGHVVDQNCNLHGWGNNKNGELGTSDSYPRPRLSQIRIFNNEKQYMRCKQVFNGRSFALGLFESNVSPNGIGPSATEATNNQRLGIRMNDHLAAPGRDSYKRPAHAALSGLSSQFAALSQTQHIAIKAPAMEDELRGAEYNEPRNACTITSARVGLSKETGTNRVEYDQHRDPQFAMNTPNAIHTNSKNSLQQNAFARQEEMFAVADSRPQPSKPSYPSQPSCDASCSALSRERRQAQYEATEIAIRKYRAQALNYKQNISRIKNNMQSSLEEETRQRHRSVSPYHNVLMNLGQETGGTREVQNYSPDIVVTTHTQRQNGQDVKHMSAEQPKQLNSYNHQSMRPSQQYSFSQLEYDFDESRHQKRQQIGERVGHEVNDHRQSDLQRSDEIRGVGRYEREAVDARGSTYKASEQTIQLIEGSNTLATIHYTQQESARTRNLNTEYQRQQQEIGRGRPAPPGSSTTDTARLAKLANGAQFRSLNLMDQPPTVTSIEALDHRQRAHEQNGADRFSRRGRSSEDGPNMNRRDPKTQNIEETNNLTRIIERSISATSSLIGRSQQSRSRSKRDVGRHAQALEGPGKQSSFSPYSRTYQGHEQKQHMEASAFGNSFGNNNVLQIVNSTSETPDGSQTTLNGHIHLNRSNNQSRTETFDISASAICTSVNPSANQSRHEMHRRSLLGNQSSFINNSSINQRADMNTYGGSQPSRVAAGRLGGEGAPTRPPPAENAGRLGRRPTGHASASYDAALLKPALDQPNLATHHQIPREKLNKYKRKLKKYFAKNAEQQTQIKHLADQVAHLERSNKRLLRADKQEESRSVKQVDALEHNLRVTEERHRRQHDQQQQEIKQLTSENIRMMAELQDRDDKHQLLDERLEFVDLEIENLGYQLKEQHELNAKLKRELAVANQTKQEDSFDDQHQTQQELQLENLQQQLQEQFEVNRRKDEELQRTSREMQSLKKKYGHVREQSRQLETTVQDLQAQVVGLSQVNHEIGAHREGQQRRASMAQEEHRGGVQDQLEEHQASGEQQYAGYLFSKRGDPLANGNQVGAQPLTFQPTTVVASLEYFDDEPSNPHRSELEQVEEQSWGHPGHRRRQGAQVYSQDTFQQEADSRDREELECEVTSQVQHQAGAPSSALTGQSTHTSQLTQPTVDTFKVRHDFGHDVVLKNQKSQRVGHGARNGSAGPSQGCSKHHTVEHLESGQEHYIEPMMHYKHQHVTGGAGSHNLSSLNVSQINQSSTSRLPGPGHVRAKNHNHTTSGGDNSNHHQSHGRNQMIGNINSNSTNQNYNNYTQQRPGTGAGSMHGLSGPAAIYQQDSQFTSNIIDQRYVQYNGCSPRDETTFEDSRALSHEVQDRHWQEGARREADGRAGDGPADMLQQQPVSTRVQNQNEQMESSYGAALKEALSPSYPPAIHQGALPEEGFPNYAYVNKMYFNGQPSHYPRVAAQEPEEQPAWMVHAQNANARGPGRHSNNHSQTRQEARGGAMSPIFSPQVAEPSLQSAGGASAFAPSAAGTVERAMANAQLSLRQPEMPQHQHQQFRLPSGDPQAVSEGTRQSRPPTHLCSQRLPTTSSGHHAGPASRVPHLATLPAGASLPPAAARTLSLGGSSQDQPAAPKFAELTPAQQSQVMALMREQPRSGSLSGGQPAAPAGEHLNNLLSKQAWAPLIPARTPNQVASAQLTTTLNMAALSVATPDLNATAASAVHDAIHQRRPESILEPSGTSPAQIVQVDATAADAQKQSEPSANQSSVLADAVDTSVVSYKDSILSKFQRRTNDKIMGQMKARDLADPVVSRSIDGSLSRSCEPQADVVQEQDSGAATQTIDREHSLVRSTSPCVGRVASIEERKSLAQARASFEHGASDPPAASKKSPAPLPQRPQDFGELRSSARLAQQRERKAADRERVDEYRERSKEWLKRRGRQPDQDCTGANDVAKTYKEAFRNLSMELKKKISTTKSPYSSIGSLKEPGDFAKIYTAKGNEEEV